MNAFTVHRYNHVLFNLRIHLVVAISSAQFTILNRLQEIDKIR